ncbi:MAG: hypothetical protein AAGJ97_09920, partial [Planctomycetota bacterium]
MPKAAPAPPDWQARLRRVADGLRPESIAAALRRPQSKAAAVSLTLHALLLAAMAAYTFDVLAETGDVATAFEEGDELLDAAIDTSLADFAAGVESLEAAAPEIEFDAFADLDAADLPTGDTLSLPSLGEGWGAGEGLSSLPFARPSQDKTVTKGSFTVWTVPSDPEPRQNYVIVIEIKVPKRVRQYRRSDLSGVVIGTDDYRQPLPGRG